MTSDHTYFTVYCNTVELTPISVRNIEDYIILNQTSSFLYVVHPKHTVGFVFDIHDFQPNRQHIIPLVRISIENHRIRLCKVQLSYSTSDLVTNWIKLYTTKKYEH